MAIGFMSRPSTPVTPDVYRGGREAHATVSLLRAAGPLIQLRCARAPRVHQRALRLRSHGRELRHHVVSLTVLCITLRFFVMEVHHKFSHLKQTSFEIKSWSKRKGDVLN